jgi:peptidoglycan/LPS O-acetylase OafA/YrhL
MDKPQKYYYPQLDAVRGLSFIAVFFYHSFHPSFGEGLFAELLHFMYGCLDYSIDVFFILSSFLLTWLGINEYERKGNFSFRNYFLRRALRIWPLYYVIMIFSFVLVPLCASWLHITVSLPPPAWYLFFVSNFYTADHVYFLRFLWTLSVEEQFYLALGLCLLFLQKRLSIMVAVFLTVSIAFNLYTAAKNIPAYFNTLTYLFDFSIGSLAALVLKKNNFIVLKMRHLTKGQSVFFYSLIPAVIIAFFFLQRQFSGAAQDLALVSLRLTFVVLAGLLIIEQMVNGNSPLQLAKNRFLIYTGKLSYGLYCFHGIVLTFGAIALNKMHLNIPELLTACIYLAVNYLIAAISYKYLEKPFLKLKDRLRRT